jgi:UDP-N-acetylmuramoyl-L-alanyl-D-glutamate--2,6-diaminopimelate ligase
MSTPAIQGWRPLKALLGGMAEVPDTLEVSDLTLDSRHVSAGSAFLALHGHTRHGVEFAAEAARRGARVVLWEPAAGIKAPELPAGVLAIAVPPLSEQVGYIADRFFDAPSAKLAVTGITGTNGKTTCAWLLAEALLRCGRPCAYLGTLGVGLPGALSAGTHTTPDAISLHRQLAAMRSAGAEAIAMEVSSHALDQDRCAGVRFQSAAFTNLSRDHLDYHGDMARYGAAKARLFEWPTLLVRVINCDDDFGTELASATRASGSLVTTSRLRAAPARGDSQFVHATQMRLLPTGIELSVASSWGQVQIRSRLLGEFNADNLLTVLAVLLASGISRELACEALADCTAPPGRMQLSGGGQLPVVVIDYAHTPDALAQALRAVRAHFPGRVVCVFGCGGERDKGKRPLMGAIAEELADEVILTDDNPRNEDPAEIIDAIRAGMRAPDRATVIADRAAAIGAALARTDSGEVVLVAGKGHEDYQQIGAERRAFSDLNIVRSALASRSAA